MKIDYCLLTMSAFLLAACKTDSPSSASAGAANAPATANAPADPTGKIKPGKYRVCEEAARPGHGSVGGKHLELGHWVRIKEFGKYGTKVCLNAEDCPSPGSPTPAGVKVLWLAGDEHVLAGESTFDHKDGSGNPASFPHFVRIYNDPDDVVDRVKCTLPNILTIEFCMQDAVTDELNCLGGNPPHLGHIHVEN